MRLSYIAFGLALAVSAGLPAAAQTALPGQPPATAIKPPKAVIAPPPTVAPAATPAAKAVAPSAARAGAPVNINTATEAQLDSIPQIGEKRAQSIIKNRPYRTLDDLVTKKALPEGVFLKIKSHITI